MWKKCVLLVTLLVMTGSAFGGDVTLYLRDGWDPIINRAESDPGLSYQGTRDDTGVHNEYNATAWTDSPTLIAWRPGAASVTGFDLSDYASDVTTLHSATMVLTFASASWWGDQAIWAIRNPDKQWVEDEAYYWKASIAAGTWNNWTTGMAMTTPNLTTTTVPAGPNTSGGRTGTTVSFDLTAIVQTWLDNAADNWGVAIVPIDGASNYAYWAGKVHETVEYRPMLVLDYESAGTLEPGNCEQAQALGYDTVADVNGDCHVNMVDIAINASQWLNCTDPQGDDCSPSPDTVLPIITIFQGTATVDGDLSDWAGVDWIAMDHVYYPDFPGTPPPDLTDAKWAARWDPVDNLIYVAASGVDTDRNYSPDGHPGGSGGWDDQDAIEFYIDANISDSGDYRGDFGVAQQYIVSPTDDTSGNAWAVLGNNYPIPQGNLPGFAAAVDAGTNTISYEIAMKPYDIYDYTTDPNNSATVTLAAGMTIGLDVIMGSKYSGGFGMMCENTDGGKSHDPTAFAHYELHGSTQLQCGDWGYLSSDTEGNCYVNLIDFAAVASRFMECWDPDDGSCDYPWD